MNTKQAKTKRVKTPPAPDQAAATDLVKQDKADSISEPEIVIEPQTISEAETVIEPEPVVDVADSEEKASAKKSKSPKNKVIRDTFSFPERDYRKISELKKTCLDQGVHVKKSEVLRAGLYLLSQLSVDELKQAVEKVEKIQTGRPSAAKK